MEIQKLFNGKLNLDDVIEAIPDGDYTYALDAVVSASADGNRGSVENIMGTTSLVSTPDMAGCLCIGGCRDSKSRSQYLFFRDTIGTDHTIVKVNGTTITKVMTWSGLNFQAGYNVHAIFVDDYLYFTDNYNGIRGFNVNDFSVSSPTSEEMIALFKRGAIYAPTAARTYNPAVNINLIGEKDFQFSYQYIYNDGQTSVISPYSKLSPRNTPAGNENEITITVPDDEAIPSNVKEIKFAVRIGNAGSFQYFATLTSAETAGFTSTKSVKFYNTIYGGAVATDYLNIYHYVPRKAKTIEFIKNRLWVANLLEGYDKPASPNMDVATQFIENVSQVGDPTLTPDIPYYTVRRHFYQTILTSSTQLVPSPPTVEYLFIYDKQDIDVPTERLIDIIDTGNGSISGKLIQLVNGAWEVVNSNYTFAANLPAVSVLSAGLNGFTAMSLGSIQTTGQIYPYGSLVAINGQFGGLGVIGEVTSPEAFWVFQPVNDGTVTIRTYAGEGDTGAYEGSRTFPNGSQYKVGLIYKDHYGRTSPVVLANGEINTATEYSNVVTATWTLPATVGNTDIPDWAESYHLVMTRNLSKSMFFEWKTARIKYYKVETVDGVEEEVLYDAYNTANKGIKVDIVPMTNVGLGYTWREGDRVVLHHPDGATVFNLAIKGYEDGFIKLDNHNIGTNPNQNITFEIYRPSVISEDLLYYEVGVGYPITNAGTGSRAFSVTAGSLTGDAFNVLLTKYSYNGTDYTAVPDGLFKEMSLDVESADWNTDIGKPHTEVTLGERIRPDAFRFSLPIVSETEINGLSEFYAANQGNVPFEDGEIMKLKSSTRTASDGTVLLALCRNKPVSIHIGEARLNLNSDVNYLVTTDKVVGDINSLSGLYGCIHPESVFDDGNFVYWYSKPRRAFVRYGSNGVHPVSDYSVVSHFEDVSVLHQEGDLIVGGYDPYYDYAICHFPNAASGFKTLSYCDPENAWKTFHSFNGEFLFDLDERFYSVLNGIVYVHNNDAAYGLIQGTQYDSKIHIPINADAGMPKVWESLQFGLAPPFIEWADGDQRIKTDASIELKIIMTNENGQETDVLKNEFEVSEYMVYAALQKDKNSTGGITDGDDMNSRTAMIELIFRSIENVYITMFKAGAIPSFGHTL